MEAAAAKWGKTIARREGKELECWRNALVGGLSGFFVGGAYGMVNAGMDVAKAAPVPGTSRVMQILKAGGRTGRNCAAFFTVYHTLLCTMRYFELNKKYDYVNVVAATAIPAVPLIMKARPDMAVCGMLVVLDNFTARQMVDAISGNREEDDDDEYEYVEVDDDEDY